MQNEQNGNGYSFFREDPMVFEGLYLGCRMAPEDRTDLLILARHHLPRMKVFSAMRSRDSFKLEFEEVSYKSI